MDSLIWVHIKILRGNFFLLISNESGKLIFNKSCGNLGIKNIQKRTKESFQNLLLLGTQYLLNLNENFKVFIKLEGAKKTVLQLIYSNFIKILKNCNINIFSVKLINKISHNGCRKTYFRK